MRTTTAMVAHARRSIGAVRRDAAFLATGLPLAGAVCLAVCLAVALPWVARTPVVPWAGVLTALALGCAVAVAPGLTVAQRARLRTRLGVDVPRLPPGGPGRLARLRSGRGVRPLAYHLVAAPAVAAGTAVLAALWAACVVAATTYVWVWGMPADWSVSQFGYTTSAAYLTVAGLVLLPVPARLTRVLARLDARAAVALLGPDRHERLTRRVADLTESRAAVLEAAEAERRRIERDLHDGAQQRLVSLAVNLGVARATLPDLSPDARHVLDAAHREAKEAITELNDLVRGLHPAVLDDRGLDAALSGLAARVPVPVRLSVRLPRRPPAAVEAVAYFVVSEALTNVVKHARAASAEVTVDQVDGRLRVVVADDGVGGADASGGRGLAGLTTRVGAVDGTLACRSPVGGPTVIAVELPCGR